MERPLKRPRLSIFDRQAPDAELEQARYMNDLCLKSRFEAIFEKYSQDFTKIGDEINVETGEIVVNNGHLESMESETDTGECGTLIQGTQRVTGKSLLRAMTVPPDVQDTDTENPVSNEIITSIETMAENAAGLTDDNSIGSEDELFEATGSREDTSAVDNEEPVPTDPQPVVIYTSEDSLLNRDDVQESYDDLNSQRSESPDSLFEVEQRSSYGSQAQRTETSRSSAFIKPDIDPDMSDAAILDKFGPEVGKQVLSLLEQQRKPNDSHLEEAWRIPVDIEPTRSNERTSTPMIASSKERDPSVDHTVSLWGKQPPRKRKRRRKPVVQRVRTPEGYREESEDPLQEYFSSGTKARDVKKLSECEGYEYSSNNESEVEDNQVDQVGQETEYSELDEKDKSDEEINTDGEDYQDSENVVSMDNDIYMEAWVHEDDHKNRIPYIHDEDQEDIIEVSRDNHYFTPDDSQADDVFQEAPRPEDNGICSYCKQQFSCKSGVMAHWDRVIRKPASRMPADDPHDIKFIRSVRGVKSARLRCPRLTQGDFRTMVELHEGGGLTFDEIVDSRALRTHKSALQLQDLYDRHRTVSGILGHESAQREPWTAEEDRCLQDLCKNPLVTMATLKRQLKGRDEIDIGNKLADGWLQLLRRGTYRASDEMTHEPKSDRHGEAIQGLAQQWIVPQANIANSDGLSDSSVAIKAEE
jgi:Centromere protein Scm3